MLNKLLYIFLLPLILLSCKVSNRIDAEEVISNFEIDNNIEKRETIFNITAEFSKGDLILKGETDNFQLKNKLINAMESFKFKDEITVLPDSTVGEYKFGLINLSVANLRSEPEYSAELKTQALMGTPVKVLKKKGGWFQIQTPDRYISWINSGALVLVTQTELSDWKDSKRVLFAGDNNSVFQTNQLESPVSDIVMGNVLNEIERGIRNIKVSLPDGRTGFVRKTDWIDFNEFKSNIQPDTTQLKKLATQLTGRPYLWGGTSVRAMDCSGFVKSLYFMNGIILARDASLQTKYGIEIKTENDFNLLQTGDLLFFGRKVEGEQKERVTHVALSLGNTEYMHASGRIKVNSLNPNSNIYSDYRRNSFIRARRVIGATNEYGIQLLKNHPWY
jgi:hypothetical protein